MLNQNSPPKGIPADSASFHPALTVLIEMHDAELDSYADLSAYGADVEGVTEFFPDRGPKVSISERIAADERRENRFRTTLTHEFGHVKFHGPLWAQKFANGDLLERGVNANKAISKRDNILDAPQSDWMEWQAGYISGALLMPATPVRRLVSDYCSPRELGPYRRHRLRFIPETWVTLLARTGWAVVPVCMSHRRSILDRSP